MRRNQPEEIVFASTRQISGRRLRFTVRMRMVTADDDMACFPCCFVCGEVIGWIDLETIRQPGKIARRMQRRDAEDFAITRTFDQAAAFARNRGVRRVADIGCQRRRKRDPHLENGAFTWPTRRPS